MHWEIVVRGWSICDIQGSLRSWKGELAIDIVYLSVYLHLLQRLYDLKNKNKLSSSCLVTHLFHPLQLIYLNEMQMKTNRYGKYRSTVYS